MTQQADHLDDDAFMRLVFENQHEVLRYVMAVVPDRTDARDLVQETLIALWKKRRQYDPAFPFVPWACRFAMNEIRLHRRRESRRRWIQDDQLIEILFERREQISSQLEARRDHLRRCLQKLPSRQRIAVESYYFHEKAVEEVAECMRTSAEAVYKILQRTRQALYDCVSRALQAEGDPL